MFAAQCLKDDTMAESIFYFLQSHPKTQVIHYNGDFHSAAHLGTAEKLARLNPQLKIAVISPIGIEPGKALAYDAAWQPEGDFLMLLHRSAEQDPNKNDMPDATKVPSHTLDVEMVPDIHFLKATDTISFPHPFTQKDTLVLAPAFKIISIKNGQTDIKYTIRTNADGFQEIFLQNTKVPVSQVTINYEGRLYYTNPAETSTWGMISDNANEGIFLPIGCWYPNLKSGLANYKITTASKHPLRLVCSGKEEISMSDEQTYRYTWTSEYPYEGLTLFGSRYAIKSKQVGDLRLSVYFRATSSEKAPSFLTEMENYITDYTSLFGPFPGSSLNMVESFLPEGMSYPDMLIFPNDLFRSPQVMLSSTVLGHEISRAWWGNSVYAKNNQGNWTDVLNNFIANYYWLEMHGQPTEPAQWRLNALQDINILNAADAYPLNEFVFAEDKSDAVIGFQKGSMFFYTLMLQMGKQQFFAGLKQFAAQYKGKNAGWDDLLNVL
jgi:hypothetical protein